MIYYNSMETDTLEIKGATTGCETLADLRRLSKKTTRQVAAEIGFTQPRITQIEGSGTNSVKIMDSLASCYGVSFERIRSAVKATIKDKDNL